MVACTLLAGWGGWMCVRAEGLPEVLYARGDVVSEVPGGEPADLEYGEQTVEFVGEWRKQYTLEFRRPEGTSGILRLWRQVAGSGDVWTRYFNEGEVVHRGEETWHVLRRK